MTTANPLAFLNIAEHVRPSTMTRQFQKQLDTYLLDILSQLPSLDPSPRLSEQIDPLLSQWRLFLARNYHPCMWTRCAVSAMDPRLAYYLKPTGTKSAGPSIALDDGSDEFEELFGPQNEAQRPSSMFMHVYMKLLWLRHAGTGFIAGPLPKVDLEARLARMIALYDEGKTGALEANLEVFLLEMHATMQQQEGITTDVHLWLTAGAHLLYNVETLLRWRSLFPPDIQLHEETLTPTNSSGELATLRLLKARAHAMTDNADLKASIFETTLYQLLIFPGAREVFMMVRGSREHDAFRLHRAELEARFTKRSQDAMKVLQPVMYKWIFGSFNWFLDDVPKALEGHPETLPTLQLLLLQQVLVQRLQFKNFVWRFVVPLEALQRHPREVLRHARLAPLFVATRPGMFAVLHGTRLLQVERPDDFHVLIDAWLQRVECIPRLKTSTDAPWLRIWKKYMPPRVDTVEIMQEEETPVSYEQMTRWGERAVIREKVRELTDEEKRAAELGTEMAKLNEAMKRMQGR